MPTFNSITGQGERPPSSEVGSAGETDGVDALLGPDTPQSIEISENAPGDAIEIIDTSDPLWAVPINTGGSVPVGGGGPSGPLPERLSPVAGPTPGPSRPKESPPIVTPLGKLVDNIFSQSPTMRDLWAKAKEKGYQIEIREGKNRDARNETDHADKNRKIYINPYSLADGHKLTAGEIASLASHEIDHAVSGPGREPPDLGTTTLEMYFPGRDPTRR
jgi:hypothetical protein